MEGLGKLGISFQSLVFYLINFGIIVLVLAKFVYKPALRFLDERRKTVEDSLKEAENIRKQFAEEIKRQEDKKAASVADLQEELDKIRQSAEKTAKNIITEAQQERERIIRQTEEQTRMLKLDLEKSAEEELLARILEVVNMAVKQEVSGNQAAQIIRKIWLEKQYSQRKSNGGNI